MVIRKQKCCSAVGQTWLYNVAGKCGQDFWFNGVLVNLDIQALNLDDALYCIKVQKNLHVTVEDAEDCEICMDGPIQVSCMPCCPQLPVRV